jgi:predicted Zn-dependent peptidase
MIDLIKEEMKNLFIKEEDIERRKKAGISDMVMTSDNIFRMNNKIMADIINLGSINYNNIDDIKSTTLEVVNSVLSRISFNNYTIFKVLPFPKENM